MDAVTHKKPIFIIEDDPFLVKAYQLKFSQEGYEVLTAMDGKEALSFLDREPAGVVLLDLMLPGASGFDILTAMRGNDRWKDVPVIILSNLGQAQDIAHGKELGAQDYLVKANVVMEEVVERVKKYVG